MNLKRMSLLAFVLIGLTTVAANTVKAHHRADHTKGGSGGGGGGYSRESFNAGVLMGTMHLFASIEDTSVSSSSKPALSNSELVVKSSRKGDTRAFLKFDVFGVVGTVKSAKILLRTLTNSSFGGELRNVSDNSWSENTMTWSNQPVINLDGPPLSEVGRVAGDVYYEWDLKTETGNWVVTGDGFYSFALTCDSCSSKYQSKESAMVPYLVVVADDGSSVASGDPDDPVLAGAGDIASCGTDPLSSGAQQTALLLDDVVNNNYDVSVFTAGDAAYSDGTLTEFQTCYDPTWGRHFELTYPSPGNHEYHTPGAGGYFTYFGDRAGDPSKGYYSYDLGSWHVIALNSNCSDIGGCDVGSPQNAWLRADLAASSAECTLAYLHHPPHSSGDHSSEMDIQPLMDALHAYGAEILVAGHDHNYERFAPQDANGVTDLAKGVRLFVAGTGGASLRAFRTPIANSEARFNSLNGVLKLSLHASSYDWEFIPVEIANPEPVEVFTDVGSAQCHEHSGAE